MMEPTLTPEAAPSDAPLASPPPNWKSIIQSSVKDLERFKHTWQENVSFRKNKPLTESPTHDVITIPADWSRTKKKVADLFFQVPEIKLRGRNPASVATAAAVAQILNFELQNEVKAYVAMDECLQDAVNASGFAAVMVGYDVTTEPVDVPVADTSMMAPEEAALVPMTTVERPVYQCYYIKRLSPMQVLKPVEFTGSDWQQAAFLGERGRVPLAEAKRRGWVDDQYEHQCKDKLETVSSDTDQKNEKDEGKFVRYTQLFYKRSYYYAEEKDPRKIHRLVHIDGLDDPKIDEPFKWQEYNPMTRQWIGMKGFPIKVATLTTISDEAIPPSDSEIGRPQVQEMMKFRSQMMRQRDLSFHLRWYDVYSLDEDVFEQMKSGVIQDMIPMNGPGSNAIGEVARANYPRENYDAMNVMAADLDEAWSMGANQQGYSSPGDTSATEAQIMAQSNDVRLSYEQARVLRLFLEVAEGLLGLMQLFQDETKYAPLLGPDGAQALAAWTKKDISGDFLFEAKPDAAQRVDVGQKRVEALNLYTKVRQDPLINPQPLIKDLLELHGLDASKMMVQPQPEPPKPAALRFSYGGPDLANPLVVALIQKNSPEPVTPEDMAAAKALMADAGIPQLPPTLMPLPTPGQDGQPPSLLQSSEEMAAASEHGGPPEQTESIDRRYEMDSRPQE